MLILPLSLYRDRLALASSKAGGNAFPPGMTVLPLIRWNRTRT